MIPVRSSNIAAVGYEGNTLIIAFRAGGVYAYHGVPEALFRQLLQAPSKGGFYTAFIKGKFASNRVG